MSTLEKVARKAARGLGPKEAGPKVGLIEPGPGASVRGTESSKNGHAAETNGRKRETIEASAETKGAIVKLVLGQLVRHPDNRRPTPADVEAMVATLTADGQLEPVLVRRVAMPDRGAEFQIISGETRYLAIKKLGWSTIDCRIVPDLDDARALQLLALCNAKRKDLDPIQKATLIARLCQPVDQGGAAMTREAAAKIYGLESGAAASNLVRLLELPDVWKGRVASGELPQSFARALTPLVPAPRLLQDLDDDWVKTHRPKSSDWEREHWMSRDGVEGLVDDAIRQDTRLLDKKAKRHYGKEATGSYEFGGEFPPLFEITDEVRKRLDVVTLTIDGKPREVATNVKEFDALQFPLVKAACLKKSKGKAAAAADDDDAEASAGPKSKTPAEQRAAQKKAGEQLEARVAGWRSRWLKGLVAASPKFSPGRDVPARMAAAIVLGGQSGYKGHHPAFATCLEKAVEDLGVGDSTSGIDDAWSAIGKAAAKTGATPSKGAQPYDAIVCDALKLLLAEADQDPRSPLLCFEFVDAIAAELEINLADAWRSLQKGDGRTLFEEFLLLHTGEQLDALADEWGLFVEGKPKAAKVSTILGSAKVLPLPKSISKLGAGGKRKRGR